MGRARGFKITCSPTAMSWLRERLSISSTSTTDNLLFCRRCFFQRYAGLAVEFAYRTLKNDAEVFPDECRVSLRQLQCCVNTQRIQLFRQSASYSPDLTNWLQPQ